MIHDDNDGKQSEEQETETNDDVNSIEDTDMPPIVGGILLSEGSGDSGDSDEDQDTKTKDSASTYIFEIFGKLVIFFGIAIGIF